VNVEKAERIKRSKMYQIMYPKFTSLLGVVEINKDEQKNFDITSYFDKGKSCMDGFKSAKTIENGTKALTGDLGDQPVKAAVDGRLRKLLVNEIPVDWLADNPVLKLAFAKEKAVMPRTVYPYDPHIGKMGGILD
jgi:hypothetical protein